MRLVEKVRAGIECCGRLRGQAYGGGCRKCPYLVVNPETHIMDDSCRRTLGEDVLRILDRMEIVGND